METYSSCKTKMH